MTNVKAIEVPMDVNNIQIYDGYIVDQWADEEWIPIEPIPPGNWQFLFLTRDMTEEQADGLVEKRRSKGSLYNQSVGHYQSSGWVIYYKNYEHEEPCICIPNTATESVNSWLRAQGLDETKNYALLKNNIDNDKK